MITLQGASVDSFFTDEDFRNEIFSKILTPSKQLSLKYGVRRSISFFPLTDIDPNFECEGFNRLETTFELFQFLMVQRPNRSGIKKIKHLILQKGNSFTAIDNTWTEHLSVVTHSLFITTFSAITSLNLSSTLKQLKLKSYVPVELALPPLPELEVLHTGITITNIEDFGYVRELTIEKSMKPFSVARFNQVQQLHLSHNDQILDITALQHNRSIMMDDCAGLQDYRYSFQDSDRISILLTRGTLPVQIDLSHFQQVRSLVLKTRHVLIAEPLYSRESLSPYLEEVTLKGLSNQIPFHLFPHLKVLSLDLCSSVTSLQGLSSVEVMSLRQLKNLTSLDGLERLPLKKVTIATCDAITSFLPLRCLPQVHISNCAGLTNGYELDQIRDLTLEACLNITDVTMLGHAQRLKLSGLHNLKTIGNLATQVPNLIILNCRNLKKKYIAAPPTLEITRTTFHKFGLLTIPDSIFMAAIFPFLLYPDRIRLISSNVYLYESLMKKTRQIEVKRDAFFFTDQHYINQILAKIENPLKQLTVYNREYIGSISTPAPANNNNNNVNPNIATAAAGIGGVEYRRAHTYRYEEMNPQLCCPDFYKLRLYGDTFYRLCQITSGINSSDGNNRSDWRVHHLSLLGGLGNMSFGEYEPFFKKAITSLSLYSLRNCTVLQSLEPTLEELVIEDCTPRGDQMIPAAFQQLITQAVAGGLGQLVGGGMIGGGAPPGGMTFMMDEVGNAVPLEAGAAVLGGGGGGGGEGMVVAVDVIALPAPLPGQGPAPALVNFNVPQPMPALPIPMPMQMPMPVQLGGGGGGAAAFGMQLIPANPINIVNNGGGNGGGGGGNNDNNNNESMVSDRIVLPHPSRLPKLKKLTLHFNEIHNLAAYTYVEKIDLCGIHLTKLELQALSHVRRLSLGNILQLQDITPLQENEKISLAFCYEVTQYHLSFRHSKSITIDLGYSEDGEDLDLGMNMGAIGGGGGIGSATNPLMIDLNYYHQVEDFSLTKDDGFYLHQGQLIVPSSTTGSHDTMDTTTDNLMMVPPTLKKIHLSGIRNLQDITCLATLQEVHLKKCPSIVSVAALGRVPVIILENLEGLVSLEGLSGEMGNRQITIDYCNQLQEFHPIRQVRTVIIRRCKGLKSSEELDGVYDLSIEDCPNLVEVGMLRNAYRLQLKSCHKVKSIEGLERVPVLNVINCKKIRSSVPMTPRIKKVDMFLKNLSTDYV